MGTTNEVDWNTPMNPIRKMFLMGMGALVAVMALCFIVWLFTTLVIVTPKGSTTPAIAYVVICVIYAISIFPTMKGFFLATHEQFVAFILGLLAPLATACVVFYYLVFGPPEPNTSPDGTAVYYQIGERLEPTKDFNLSKHFFQFYSKPLLKSCASTFFPRVAHHPYKISQQVFPFSSSTSK